MEASTSSAKAMLYDTDKGVLKVESITYSKRICKNGIQDPESIYQTVLSIGKRVSAGADITAVAISATWHNLLITDQNLRPKTKAFTWNFMDAMKTAEKLRQSEDLCSRIYHNTGCMPHGTYPPYRYIYLKENGYRPEPNDVILNQGAYMFARLTGVIRDSKSMASGNGWLNINQLDWDREILSFVDLTPANFPDLGEYDDYCSLLGDAADMLGISAKIPVVLAHPDGALNQLSAGGIAENVMTLSVGTSAAIRLAVKSPYLPDRPSTWCYYMPGSWLAGAAIAGAANCVDWFVDEVMDNCYDYKTLDRLAANEMGELPVFMPFLFGERCPGWNDMRLGGFQMIKGTHNAPALYKAILMGVCFNLLQCYEVLTSGIGIPNRICVSGGIMQSPVWLQMLSDIFNSPLHIASTQHASLLGGAYLALFASGEIHSIQQIFGSLVDNVLEPQVNMIEYYYQQYQVYLEAYQKTF
ncbi:MAG: FGGY-family carbohydrate kinase [Saccharofermentanales bacterium]